MTYYSFWRPSYSGELYHYGVLGMKWGVHKANRLFNKSNTLMSKADRMPNDYDDYPNKTNSNKLSRKADKI